MKTGLLLSGSRIETKWEVSFYESSKTSIYVQKYFIDKLQQTILHSYRYGAGDKYISQNEYFVTLSILIFQNTFSFQFPQQTKRQISCLIYDKIVAEHIKWNISFIS